jgi:hypothetical protein
MRIQTTDAQAWWIALADEIRPVDGLDTGAFFPAIQSAFNIPVLPLGPKPGGGVEFENGAIRDGVNSVVISKIAIYGDGVSIHVPSNTTNAEIVLQKLLEVARSFGVRNPITPPVHYYLSAVVADFDVSLDRFFPQWLLEKVSAAIGVEGDAEFFGMNINFDRTKIGQRLRAINPTLFNVHRRIETPYDLNRYFSQANMTTEKHIEILSDLEKFVLT